ncbi:MAG: Pr6Pr family membrane protein [Gemmatimonadota bacterium]
MNRRSMLISMRLAFGILTLVAIVAQLRVHMRGGFDVVNFFSYFTNLSNLFAAAMMLTAAGHQMRGRELSPVLESVRGASVVAMVVVGVVFSVLLRKADLGALMPWVNSTLHYIMPVVTALDWIIQPPKNRLSLRNAGTWAIFPLAYLAYTLARGAAVGWYPYPFLNPANVGGYGGVALYAIAIVVVFSVASWILIAVAAGRRRKTI